MATVKAKFPERLAVTESVDGSFNGEGEFNTVKKAPTDFGVEDGDAVAEYRLVHVWEYKVKATLVE